MRIGCTLGADWGSSFCRGSCTYLLAPQREGKTAPISPPPFCSFSDSPLLFSIIQAMKNITAMELPAMVISNGWERVTQQEKTQKSRQAEPNDEFLMKVHSIFQDSFLLEINSTLMDPLTDAE